MKTRLLCAVAALALCAALALAEPAFRMSYPAGVPRAQIDGDYSLSRYAVWRASAPGGPFVRVTESEVLCLGSCYADDPGAVAGRTYWYRFDLSAPDGQRVSFGPYAATISTALARRIGATVAPNPGRGAVTVRLFLAGTPGSAPIETEASLHDLQGRRLVVLQRGPLAAGSTTVSWDGRRGDGAELPAGAYFLRVATADGRSSVTRVLRVR